MARLEVNKPLMTRESILKLDGLEAGQHRIQLRVFDDAGNVSRPDIVTIDVKRTLIRRDPVDTRTNVSNIVINRPSRINNR